MYLHLIIMSVTNNKNIIYDLLKYITTEINDNIEFFFKKYYNQFDQDYADIETKGETIEQYKIYKKYELMIDHDLEIFCKLHGYHNTKDLINTIDKMIKYENINVKKEMEALNNNDNVFENLFEITTADIVNLIIDLSSYKTFSTIIRNKVVIDKIMNSTDKNEYSDIDSDFLEEVDESEEDPSQLDKISYLTNSDEEKYCIIEKIDTHNKTKITKNKRLHTKIHAKTKINNYI
jgi:hypothetical protein